MNFSEKQKRVLKRIGIGVAGLVLTVMLLLGGSLLYFNTAPGRNALSSLASAALDEPVVVAGKVRLLAEWPPAVRFRGFSITPEAKGKAKIADISEMEISLDPWPLFAGEIVLPRLLVKDSQFRIAYEPETKKEDAGLLALPRIGALSLSNVKLDYKSRKQRIDISLRGDTKDDTVTLAGGGIYQAKKFKLKAHTAKLLDIATENPMPLDMVFTVGNTTLDAKGTVRDLFALRGMDVTLRVKGADASELFPLLGIALPPTSPYDLRGRLDYADETWRFSKFSGRMGDSDLRGDLRWDTGRKRPLLTAKFISQKLDFADLGPLIGLAPEAPASAEQQNKAVTQEASPFVIPDVPLDVSRLAAMDAEVTFTGKKVISSHLPLDDFYMKVSVKDRVLELIPLRFGTASGDISATITVNSNSTPVAANADFTFSRLSLLRIMEKISSKLGKDDVTEGYIGGTARVKGYGKSLHDILATSDGVAGFGMEGGSLSNLFMEFAGLDIAQSLGFLLAGDEPVPIRCVVASFRIKSGLMSAEHLMVDTTDTKLDAGGTLDLGTEKMDLRFKAQPKDATLLTLRSPIRVQGTLKNPDVWIEKENLAARIGAAAVISVALTPLAGIVAFIEPGLGKDSNCKALLQEMNKNTGKTGRTDQVPVNK